MSLDKPPSRASERRAKLAAKLKLQRQVYQAVTERDRYRCRACGQMGHPGALDMLRRLHMHHIVFRSRGGVDSTECIASLCSSCHADVHAHRLIVSGNADGVLVFARQRVQ